METMGNDPRSKMDRAEEIVQPQHHVLLVRVDIMGSGQWDGRDWRKMKLGLWILYTMYNLGVLKTSVGDVKIIR